MSRNGQLVCFDLGRVLVRLVDSLAHAAQRACVAIPAQRGWRAFRIAQDREPVAQMVRHLTALNLL